MGFGVLATINEDIDFDTAAIVADDFGYTAQRKDLEQSETSLSESASAAELNLQNRPPIVTIMGHVDHGKTTLLDTIRRTNVAAKEAGGITQHISSYQIEVAPKGGGGKRKITFLDTPGHSAFEAMRRHGARITDLVVLVVAADDGVKPQTVEAIKHAQQMKVPILVAINKIDKPDADIDKVKAELAEQGLVSEDWGGKTVTANISAKANTGISELLELILLATDLRELKANFEVPAVGVVIESHLQPGIGPVATVLVQNGILKVGDYVAIGPVSGRVRTLVDYRNKRIQEATPSTPVAVSGLSDIPQFGEQLAVFKTEKDAKDSARQHIRSHTAKRASSALHLSAEGATQKEGSKNILYLIIKADTKGSLEAIRDTLNTMRNEDVEVRVISDGVGDISESDITMAATSKALVIGFQVRIPAVIKALADREKVSVSLFSVVYELFDAVREVLANLMPMLSVEKELGRLKILARFRDNRKNIVIGGLVEEGFISDKQSAKILRADKEITQGKVISVHHGKETIKQARAGSECGVELEMDEEKDSVGKGDLLVTFTTEEEKKPLGL